MMYGSSILTTRRNIWAEDDDQTYCWKRVAVSKCPGLSLLGLWLWL